MFDQNTVIHFENENKDEIKKTLDELFAYEETLEDNSNVKLDLKGKSLDTIAFVLKEAMNNPELKNIQLLTNVLCLLKSYFTFDSSFFDSEDIYVNKSVELIDLKRRLKEDIDRVSRQVAIYFLSICRSLNKVEYTMLDSYRPLPNLYHTIFLTTDMVTISSILCDVKDGSFSECSLVRDANLYFNSIMSKYRIGNEMMNEFLRPILKQFQKEDGAENEKAD